VQKYTLLQSIKN